MASSRASIRASIRSPKSRFQGTPTSPRERNSAKSQQKGYDKDGKDKVEKQHEERSDKAEEKKTAENVEHNGINEINNSDVKRDEISQEDVKEQKPEESDSDDKKEEAEKSDGSDEREDGYEAEPEENDKPEAPVSPVSEVEEQPPEIFDGSYFLNNLLELSTNLETEQFQTLGEDFPVDELKDMVNAVVKTMKNFSDYAKHSQNQMEEIRDKMKSIKDRIHKKIAAHPYEQNSSKYFHKQ